MTGELRLNGQKYSMHDLKQNAGYVMQDDLLNGNLTVLETLQYTAELRLPRSMTREARRERIDTVMGQMGLTKVQDVIVGTPLKKGISGGERKRLCVAMELLTKPLLLFLDEPTSGLDSVTALSLCRKLRELADAKACTVVCTIHQPQAKIFRLFQNLVLLKAGKIVYMGPSEKALHFFEGLGYKCPAYENPADYFLDGAPCWLLLRAGSLCAHVPLRLCALADRASRVCSVR
jgi:ATP-binding cassette subfamily G (WHITE) protein 2